jgi:hypothetical protein
MIRKEDFEVFVLKLQLLHREFLELFVATAARKDLLR